MVKSADSESLDQTDPSQKRTSNRRGRKSARRSWNTRRASATPESDTSRDLVDILEYLEESVVRVCVRHGVLPGCESSFPFQFVLPLGVQCCSPAFCRFEVAL